MQRGDVGNYGASYKIVFMTNYQVTNQLSCFRMNGSSDFRIKTQTIFPDTTNMNVSLVVIDHEVQCS